jgi:hypothetical protein
MPTLAQLAQDVPPRYGALIFRENQTVLLKTEEPYRIPFQDAVAIHGRQLELFDHGARVFDVPGVETVRTDHDAV